MKNILKLLMYTSVITVMAIADMTRVEVGAGSWLQDTKGSASYSDSGADGSYTSNEYDSSKAYIWALIKHPIPVVPNLRLEYVGLKDEGVVSGQFKDFDVTGTANMSYDMKQYDFIPYYNILDNTAWITLDLGVDIKVIDLSYDMTLVGASTATGDLKGSETIAIPLLYARGRFEVPSTDIGIEADVKYISYGDSSVYDVRAKIDYTLDFMPVIQPAVELGYRIQKVDIDESDADANVDLKFSGVYLGLVLRF
ncbi:TIGR04219 family outer membrane beta-barrel protein [Sulfurimonas sp.]|nr:TIGR04219 family outer membrane beta-barrel protein [Sulfurimonas sp.]